MQHIKLYILLMAPFVGVFPFTAGAQEALLHVNKPFYVTGEIAWYQLYLPAGLQGQAFTVQATVLNEQEQAIEENFINSAGLPVCRGYYSIPYSLPSGMYRLWFTATAENGAVQTLAVGDIPIYNDLEPLPGDIQLSERPQAVALPEGPLEVRLALEAGVPVRPRQPLGLRIQVYSPSGEALSAWGSVSVLDEGLCGNKAPDGNTRFTGPPLSAAERYRSGFNWPGVAVDEDGQPLNTPLLGVLGVDDGRLMFTRTDKEGRFLLTLPEYTGRQRWQFIDHAAPGLSIHRPRNAPPGMARPLAYTSGILEYLHYSRQRKKIYQLYGTQETALPVHAPSGPTREPAWEASFSYFVPDYERFPDMATFFTEVVPAVRFLARGEGYAASIYNPASQDYFSAPPLFLIDGKATRDATFIGALNPASIERVSLLTDPSQLRAHFPAIGAGGVIHISTKIPNFRLPDGLENDIFSLPGLQPPAEFEGRDADASLPALRPAVLWSPALRITEQEGAFLTFHHSDDYGEFCIEVVVQSEDGRRGSGRYCYMAER